MKTHELKIWPIHYEPVASGKKKAELRINDRGYEAGDMLLMREWEPAISSYTGRSIAARVTHVLQGNPLPETVAMLSIRLLK